MGHPIREHRIRQRLNWFRKVQALGSVTDACTFFGISRKTYYKWWHRYAASSWDRLSLADRSRRPHRHPRQVGTRMARRLRRWRKRTEYGARRLAWHLRRQGVPEIAPARSGGTGGNVLPTFDGITKAFAGNISRWVGHDRRRAGGTGPWSPGLTGSR